MFSRRVSDHAAVAPKTLLVKIRQRFRDLKTTLGNKRSAQSARKGNEDPHRTRVGNTGATEHGVKNMAHSGMSPLQRVHQMQYLDIDLDGHGAATWAQDIMDDLRDNELLEHLELGPDPVLFPQPPSTAPKLEQPKDRPARGRGILQGAIFGSWQGLSYIAEDNWVDDDDAWSSDSSNSDADMTKPGPGRLYTIPEETDESDNEFNNDFEDSASQFRLGTAVAVPLLKGKTSVQNIAESFRVSGTVPVLRLQEAQDPAEPPMPSIRPKLPAEFAQLVTEYGKLLDSLADPEETAHATMLLQTSRADRLRNRDGSFSSGGCDSPPKSPLPLPPDNELRISSDLVHFLETEDEDFTIGTPSFNSSGMGHDDAVLAWTTDSNRIDEEDWEDAYAADEVESCVIRRVRSEG